MPRSDAFQPDTTAPPQEVTTKEVLDAFTNVVSSPKNRAALRKALVHNKPSHWSARSNAPYYREVFAQLAQKILDRIIQNGRPQIYYYKDFPTTSPNTIYMRFNQGKQYLLDHMDPDGRYSSICQAISIDRRRGVGIVIALRKDILDIERQKGNLDMLMPKELSTVNAIEWRDKMERWIEEGNPLVPFHIDGLALSPEDIEALNLELNALPNVCANITPNSIKLVKTE